MSVHQQHEHRTHPLHPLSPRHLFLRTGRRRYYRCGLAALLLLAMLGGVCTHAGAVVPYRAPDDIGPSPLARQHLESCRNNAAAAASLRVSDIESESFSNRNEREYYRFVLREGRREILVICDAATAVIRRQIDIWGEL
ncbi:hypothetical protein PQR62_02680 [Herbaspirillum lusitanum]|uniref:PepSY domain-containing protein n=1 Tax=Herbaspirillum lusitanum TaxID=213312 RepID=A0ABW9A2V1_9BURK